MKAIETTIKAFARHISSLPSIGKELGVGLLLLFSSCDSYIDITPKGAITVDTAEQYYELIANPMRGYHPSAFAFLTDELWSKESYIIGYENISYNGINMTFNEQADRTLLSDRKYYPSFSTTQLLNSSSPQILRQLLCGASPVADAVLDVGTQLGKRLVVAVGLEDGVVAEALGTALLACYHAVDDALEALHVLSGRVLLFY